MGHLKSIPLTEEQAATIERMVASGAYANAGEVVNAGLEALAGQDAALTAWLRAELLPTLDQMDRDPGSMISAEEVFADLRAHHARRLADG